MKKAKIRTIHKLLSVVLSAALAASSWGDLVSAGTEKTIGTVEAAGENIPGNPVHHCANDDNTDWSYIYFGSYPQTEVAGRDLTDAIESASYDANGDAVIDGVKYRKVYDSYWEENHYFKWEKIKWRVLQNDGTTLFVMADTGLDCKKYHEENAAVTWESSTIREWLNSDFYGTAFSPEEQAAITEQDVEDKGNPVYDIEGGNNTRDKVYLLSLQESVKSEYGFCKDVESRSLSRQVKVSNYAESMGASSRDGNCSWWLRSPGQSTANAADVNYFGDVLEFGDDVDDSSLACVPALHINLNSSLWSLDNIGGTAAGTPVNPVHHCTKDDITEYSYVYFGSYPQTEIAGQALTDEIRNASYDANGDATVNGIGYRRVNDSDYADYIHYRYYRWEKIKWRVLQNNGDTLFVLADRGLDCKKYHQELTNDTWETCSLRQWLNDDFYNTAFSSGEQSAIIEQTVANEANAEYETAGGTATQDYVYLLSVEEWTNPAYGYCDEVYKTMPASDYAGLMGAAIDSDDGTCYWWLRSLSNTKNSAMAVSSYGGITHYEVNTQDHACIPALHIDLQSDLWTMEDDGSGTAPGKPTEEEEAAAKKAAAEALTNFIESKKPTGTEADYTAESWQAYQKALTDAQNILENETATSTQIKSAQKALEDAFNGLKRNSGGGTTPGGSTGDNSGSSTITVSKPADQAVKTGSSATFAVNTSGGSGSGATCQWYYAASPTGAGTLIPGATSFIYTLPKTDSSLNGRYYYCIVKDGPNSVTSSRAKLTVYWPPKVTEPKAVTVTEGQSATFSVTASGGNPSVYTYKWFYKPSRNSDKTIYIDGAASASYTIKNTTTSMSYRYYGCIVSNGIYNVPTEYSYRLLVNEKPVKKKKQTITAPSSITLAYGSEKYIKAKAKGDAYLTYKSSNPSIVYAWSSLGCIEAKKYGTATITVKAEATATYKSATKKIKVKVVPKTAKLTQTVSPGSRRLSLKWKKDKTVTGYEINISPKKNFKSRTVSRKFKASQTSIAVAGFPSGKFHYVRIRSYKKVGGKNYYSSWSKVKKVKIK